MANSALFFLEPSESERWEIEVTEWLPEPPKKPATSETLNARVSYLITRVSYIFVLRKEYCVALVVTPAFA